MVLGEGTSLPLQLSRSDTGCVLRATTHSLSPECDQPVGTRAERQFPGRIEQGLAAQRRLGEPETRPLAAGTVLGSLGKLWAKCPWDTCSVPIPSLSPDSSSTAWDFTPLYPHAKPGKQLVPAQPKIVSIRALYNGSRGQPSPNWAKRCSRHCQEPGAPVQEQQICAGFC